MLKTTAPDGPHAALGTVAVQVSFPGLISNKILVHVCHHGGFFDV